MLSLALAAAALLTAAPPGPQKPEYGQALSPAWGRSALCATASTTYAVKTSEAALSPPACFGWGTLVHLTADGGRFVVCQSGTSTVTFGGDIASGLGSEIVDTNGPDGVGACIPLIASQSGDMVIKSEVVRDAPGSRHAGICTAPVITAGGGAGYPLCRVDGDCTDAGAAAGTTCDTTLSTADLARIETHGCAQIVLQCDANTTKLNVRVDR